MKVRSFYRWYFADDTRRWQRVATGFLLVATVAVVLGLLVWWITARWS